MRISAPDKTACGIFSAVSVCVLLLLSLVLLSCGGEDQRLPEGGYDYRMEGDILLGYPIPRLGENSMCLCEDTGSGTAYRFDGMSGSYVPLSVRDTAFVCGKDRKVFVPCAGEDGKKACFSADVTDDEGIHYRVWEGELFRDGDVKDGAVTVSGCRLLFCGSNGCITVTDSLCTVLDVWEERILYTAENASGQTLYLRHRGESKPLYSAKTVSDGWFAALDGRYYAVFSADGAWFMSEEGGDPHPVPPAEELAEDLPVKHFTPHLSCAMLRGTVFTLLGDDDRMWFVNLLSGVPHATDMGGIYRFDGSESTALPLSPDRQTAFMTDYDYLYRLCLADGAFSVILNEAPTFENTCPLSSVTAVNDSRLLLSQASAEYTEFVPVITEGIFAEEIPERRHEDEKIDLDTHAPDDDGGAD